MNAIDLKVIDQLMKQARTTWAELGAILGLTAPAAAERVRRLEEKGVIKGYAAVVDPEAVGCLVTAFVAVTLDHPSARSPFLEKMAHLPQVQECHHVAGDFDYLLKIRCASLRQLEGLISEQLKETRGVVRSKTTVVLSTVKETSAVPLAGSGCGDE
ncbi:Lrp/AsnC family leucine-responsive transcriptional regulator [Hydrogenispora ethanolica]|jgi:Lrp/AsnC family leucine-responsive transcriptional regulator|uniref:Lrp/AsnC family leucine-responsive transcriptional regulator n=1 Tax=Hydrogenispora ethanolica TaxID=1082276 RepID=A0A4R1RFQ7_HYDET|nr:Lrp/AsnC family transcriptional regulator [Hydrogenispora ethanolica]TCL64756.1 Lrp/AsnC family leucine-responsive transcriptional regulator [Hydrogenispora ethanolica]